MMSYPTGAMVRLAAVFSLALSLLASPLAAQHALAQSGLYPGAVGFVANASGEPVLLREAPSFDAAVVSSFPVGTPADVVEGPVTGEDGTPWLGVSVGGAFGYMVAGNLADGGAAAAPVELAQEAAPVDAAPVETMSAEMAPAAAPAGETTGNPVATADLNLRAGPSYDDAVMLVIPEGAPVVLTGEWSEAFAGATYNGQYGWVDSAWLDSTQTASQEAVLLQEAAPVVQAAPLDAAPVDGAGIVGDLAAPGGELVYALDVVNLRAGPAESDAVLRVVPTGGAVTVTGAPVGGFTPVWYNGTWGFIGSEFLGSGTGQPVALAQEAAPEASYETFETAWVDPAAESGSGQLLATAVSDVNLRAGPEMAAPVMTTIPAGTTLEPLAGPEQGFYQLQYGDQVGWASGEFLEVSASYLQKANREQQRGKVSEGREPEGGAELGAGGIIWPVSGGLWYIMQGYHGSSHQNQDGLWQYEYSLDLARRDGNTAGQPVHSPVNGVVRWTDPSTGGISIDIGNGHAVAMFHVTFMAGLEAGTTVYQGQHLGEISGPGGNGFAGTPHLHFTLWASSDNGNWDRQAVPFTGQYAISGMDFADTGGGNAHRGVEFSP